MKNIVMALALILLVGSSCKFIRKTFSKHVNVVAIDTTSRNNAIDSAKYYSSMGTENSSAVNSTAKQQNTGGNYYMIVGCFTVPSNADKYAEKIRGMGYNVQIIQGKDNFQMVAVRSYASYRESIGELDKFRNEVTPRAWVFVRK